MRRRKGKIVPFIFLLLLGVLSCAPQAGTETPPTSQTATTAVTSSTALPTIPYTPQSLSAPGTYGPNLENFPKDFNPLTAQQVKDPGLLETPAVMVSISHFPVNARPQAGLSFASWVFEFYITEGATRFLSVFYGGFPEPEIPITGDCTIRREPYQQTPILLGNRVWLDENQNGTQEDYEKGVGGVCINLYDSSGGLIQQTSSDSNGYYGFNVQAGKYTVEFKIPAWLGFTESNLGDEKKDSDVDQAAGRVEADVRSTLLYLDAGLLPSEEMNPPMNESVQLPAAEVGPVRSGRLLYIDIHDFFLNSCFIYASATLEILDLLPHCYLVPHDDTGGGAMLPLEKMKELAGENKNATLGGFNYASNLFSDEPPAGGFQANRIDVYVAYLNQSAWIYDVPSQTWWRFVDDANFDTAGQLHPEIDRLTGRQLQFENVIVLYAEHEVVAPAILDMNLELGNGGYAYLFRDGLKYDIRWSTKARAYEKKTGKARPLYFVDAEGNPVPLKPGRTFIFIATPYSFVTNQGDGLWAVRYMPPEGAQ